MRTTLQHFLCWAPRILGLVFAAFLSLFALDVLDGRQGFWLTTLALLTHLIPTGILLAVLALSWRWPWVGGLAFPALGVFYLANSWGRFHWSTYAVIAGPLTVVGALFLCDWWQRRTTPQPA